MNFSFTNTSIKPGRISRHFITGPHPKQKHVIDIAEFEFSDGLRCMKANSIPQLVMIKDLNMDDGFIVSEGKVWVQVRETDYPEIKRVIA